ncbi:hypothetical protein [Camelimonas lactis]|uniref:Uncharacterized protein n=1 Tax=Camelimonas lactis TaxID=659006 RepID=A0A4R2GSH1_9HYPH|nr:hypothetical protein [Camelimonas lactis]TCO11235.1 hypothetical protein EV666_11371 [Camelimonas lactis]
MPVNPNYSGKMTFEPAANAKIYRNQIVRCVVTYAASLEDDNLPSNIAVKINFLGGVWPDNDTLAMKDNAWTLSLTSVGDQTPPVYEGEFYAFAPASERGGSNVGYEIILSGYSGESQSLWALQKTVATVNCSLDRAAVPVNPFDGLNADELGHKVVMKAAVTDGSGVPVPGYAVYWSGGNDQNVFNNVNAFADTDRLHKAPVVSSEIAPGSPIIHGKTDEAGVARLTLVTKTIATRVALSCWGQVKGSLNMEAVAVYDPDVIDYNYSAPSVNLPTDGGRLNLDGVTSNTVPITISTNPFERGQHYDLFIFMNGRSVQYQELYFPTGEPLPLEVAVFLAKPLFNSDSDAKGGREPDNEIFYVVSSQQGGCRTSVSTGKFHCIGERGEYAPDPTISPRDLPPPLVENASQVVNVNTIQNGLRLKIPVKAAKGWTPKVGDLLSSTIYLQGWSLWTNEHIGNAFQSSTRIAEADITAGEITVIYPSANLRGYVPDQNGPDQAKFYAEYYVVRANEADEPENEIYSEYVMLNLDTGA